MGVMTKCASCGYPISAEKIGSIVTCPMCGIGNEILQGVTIPTWMFAGGIGMLIGIIAGPAIIGSTEGGAAWLRKQATKKLQ